MKYFVEGASTDEGVWRVVKEFDSKEKAEEYISSAYEQAEGWDGEYSLRVKA